MRGSKMTEERAALVGAIKKNPKRYNKQTPKNPNELGEPPERLSYSAKEIWYEIVENSLPGVLTAAERVHLELLCVLMLEFRTSADTINTTKITQIVTLLGKLGMNPIDRQKLGVEKPKKDDADDPFKGFN